MEYMKQGESTIPSNIEPAKTNAGNWLTSQLLACPILKKNSVGDELNQIC
jgi:hypothetical protein